MCICVWQRLVFPAHSHFHHDSCESPRTILQTGTTTDALRRAPRLLSSVPTEITLVPRSGCIVQLLPRRDRSVEFRQQYEIVRSSNRLQRNVERDPAREITTTDRGTTMRGHVQNASFARPDNIARGALDNMLAIRGAVDDVAPRPRIAEEKLECDGVVLSYGTWTARTLSTFSSSASTCQPKSPLTTSKTSKAEYSWSTTSRNKRNPSLSNGACG
ncbi:hypothetical protein pipiens_011245, partial [Culex pipiens pipiens]